LCKCQEVNYGREENQGSGEEEIRSDS